MSVVEFVVSVMCSCQTTNVSVVVGPINPVTACPKLCDSALCVSLQCYES